MKRVFLSVILIVMTFAMPAHAAAIEISNPMAKAQTDLSAPGGIFMTIVNKGGADKLVSIKTPVAKMAQIHNSKMKMGKMRMRRKTTLSVGANSTVELVDGGLHIMLIGVKAPLKSGASFPLTLVFQNAGTIDVTVLVQ